MRRARGPLRARELKPTEGPKRYLAHHTLAQLVPLRGNDRGISMPPSAKVVRMFHWLMDHGWEFNFKVEAKSPRGFVYAAEAPTPIKAFLKAFGQLHKEEKPDVPKRPEVKADVRRPPVPVPAAPAAKEPQAYLSELFRDVKRELPVAA